MPTQKDSETKVPEQSGDAGQAEVQAKVDEETEKGYRGVKVDPLPNLAYSIQTGPDSPSGSDDRTRAPQHDLQEG